MRELIREFQLNPDLVRPPAGSQQSSTSLMEPPEHSYTIYLVGRPGHNYKVEYAWDALESVFPDLYPPSGDSGDPDGPAQDLVARAARTHREAVRHRLSHHQAEHYVHKLTLFRVPRSCWSIEQDS